jgi:CHAT domain-containing protein
MKIKLLIYSTLFFFLSAKNSIIGQKNDCSLDSLLAANLLIEAQGFFKKYQNGLAIGKSDSAAIIYLRCYGNNSELYGDAVTAQANAYWFENRAKSLKYFEEAHEIRKNYKGDKLPKLNEAMFGEANFLLQFGENLRAAELYEQVLKNKIALGQPRGSWMGRTYDRMGVCYSKMGNTERAMHFFKLSTDYFKEFDGENSTTYALSFNNLGVAYKIIGDLDKAIECYEKVLLLLKTSTGQEDKNYSSAYANLTNVYKRMKNYDKALYYINLVIEIDKVKYDSTNTDFLATDYLNLGDILNQEGKHNEAIQNFNHALSLYKVGLKTYVYHSDFAICHHGIADALKGLGNFENAEQKFQVARLNFKFQKNNFEDIQAFGSLIECLQSQADNYYLWYKYTQNTEYLQKSLEILEEIQSGIRFKNARELFSNSQVQWQSIGYETYNIALRNAHLLPIAEFSKEGLFDLAEQSKGAILLNNLRKNQAFTFANKNQESVEALKSLHRDMLVAEQKVSNLSQTSQDSNNQELNDNRAKMLEVQREYTLLWEKEKRENPRFYNLAFDFKTISVQEIQQNLLENDQSLLEYVVGDSSIFLFLIQPKNYQVLKIEKNFPLEKWVEDLRSGLSDYHTSSNQSEQLFKTCREKYTYAARNIYQKLIAPIQSQLTENLIIIPDGVLGYVPFETLLMDEPTEPFRFSQLSYLIRKHSISYAFSATLLQEMRNKKHQQNPKIQMGAFAPYYDGDTTQLSQAFKYDLRTRRDLQPLPESGAEVFASQKIMGGDLFLGDKATEENFVENAWKYRMLHLASHAVANDKLGDYAYIAFNPIKDSIENELLYLRDLYSMNLNADLVVLSACETGLGKLQKGEGIISLSRAFAYAGAKSIVNTFWSVQDKSSRELMVFFFKNLKKGKPKNIALRKAKLDFLNDNKTDKAHPFYWAGFVLNGDWKAIGN